MMNGSMPRRGGKKKCSWKKKLLSLGGSLVLINRVLSNMVLPMISSLVIRKSFATIYLFRSRFFWQGHVKKYQMANWNVVSHPKDQ
jgi:hypothetical protein